MTRKGKIGWAVAAIALVGAAIAFWPGDTEGELKVSVAPVGSNQVAITITNTSKRSFEYRAWLVEIRPMRGGGWITMDAGPPEFRVRINGRTQYSMCTATIENRWHHVEVL